MGKNFSTFSIAEMLQVDPGSVANWIDQDLLKAHRTPGGHRRVAEEDLLRFLHEHKMPVPAQLGGTRMRVLVVDDEANIAQMISRTIASVHPEYEVIQAHDGFRAGTLVAMMKPNVVILDLRMPGMDGFEVCRMIKSQDDTKHTQVLAMTAYPSPDGEKRILDCGARVCLTKPLDMGRLVKEIEESLG